MDTCEKKEGLPDVEYLYLVLCSTTPIRNSRWIIVPLSWLHPTKQEQLRRQSTAMPLTQSASAVQLYTTRQIQRVSESHKHIGRLFGHSVLLRNLAHLEGKHPTHTHMYACAQMRQGYCHFFSSVSLLSRTTLHARPNYIQVNVYGLSTHDLMDHQTPKHWIACDAQGLTIQEELQTLASDDDRRGCVDIDPTKVLN